MTREFTAEELKEVIRAARVFNPGFSEEKFRGLVELQRHIGDQIYLETVRGVHKLEKEMGVPLGQALETYVRLVRDNEELSKEVTAHRIELEALKGNLRGIKDIYRRTVKAIEEATAELKKIKQEKEREEKELLTFRQKVAVEKERINKELVDYRRKADVTEAEIATACEMKAEVTKHGFTLEQALGVAAEFSGYGDARERLAQALKKYGKLTGYLKALEAEIRSLEDNKRQIGDNLSHQTREIEQNEAFLSQLKVEIAEKVELVNFYHRYAQLRSLIEYLGSSDHLTFHHCLWCGALFWILRSGNVGTRLYKCPWCGLTFVEPDRNAYATLSQPPGTPLKLLW